MRAHLLAFLLCSGSVLAQEKPPPSAAAAERMRAAAERVLAAIPERDRAKAMRPFEDRDRVDWH